MPIDAPFVLRTFALSLTLVLAMATLGARGRARVALLPLLVCMAAYLMRSAPQALMLPPALLPVLTAGALLFPVAFWWLVRSAFEDRADLPWPAGLAALALLLVGLSSAGRDWSWTFSMDRTARTAQKAIAAGFVLHALWQLWSTRVDDLVAGRRRLRPWLLAYIGLHGLAVLAVELLRRDMSPPPWLDGLNVGVISLALAATLAAMLRLDVLALATLFGSPAAPAAVVADRAPQPALDPDAGHVAQLQRFMSDERLYRDPDLSLANVATQLRLPEYRLRDLINRRLGYRNFPSFLNEYRLREVEARLADPSCDRLPVLTLALEAGFGSIGPFNRAFKERYGVTPTAYRGRRSASQQAAG